MSCSFRCGICGARLAARDADCSNCADVARAVLPPRDEEPCAKCGRYGCDGTPAGHAIASRPFIARPTS